jgi:predicted NBD/HSP70 family sugar kinase
MQGEQRTDADRGATGRDLPVPDATAPDATAPDATDHEAPDPAAPATAATAPAVPDLGGASARAVYRDLLRFGPRSRRDLTERLGLSAPTVTRVTRELLELGHLHPLETVALAKGRPQQPLDIEENHGPRFVGVKVTAEEAHAVVTTARGNALEELVMPLPGTSASTLVDTVVETVLALVEAHPRVAGIGVSIGGRVADRRRVDSSWILGWDRPVDLADLLEERLRLPVAVDNDIAAMIHGLNWFGIGRAYRTFAVLTIGVGVAIGTVVEGRLLQGRSHLAGLTGRLPVDAREDGAPLPFWQAARTAAVVAAAREAGALGEGEGVERLRELLAAGDPAARAVCADLARTLARAAAAVVAVVDPEAVVLGGETIDLVLAADGVFERTLRESLPTAQQDLVVRELGGDFDQWARGAAVIAVQEFVGGEVCGTPPPTPSAVLHR